MKRSIYIAMILILMATLPTLAARYEGEVVKVNSSEQSLVLAKANGQTMVFKLAKGAKLYYNNESATLSMYTPVTKDDFVSGYLETDRNGLVVSANFFYLVREGTIGEVKNGRMTLHDLESGIADTYELGANPHIYLNNLPTAVTKLTQGMRALVVLDYRYKVKKIAVFHYDYTGLIEAVDLFKQTVTINIGTRLTPNLREFQIGGTPTGACSEWETVAHLLQGQTILFAKFSVAKEGNSITVIEIRSI